MNGGSTPAGRAVAVHFVCVVALAAGVGSLGMFARLVIESPVVIIAYSLVRSDKERSSLDGFSGLPLGALLNAFGAIVLGAPFWIEYLKRTINWSLLMSLFTFVPAVCVLAIQGKIGCAYWLLPSKMARVVDYMVSLPAHGAVMVHGLGLANEWPICVTYGAVLGYVVGVLASLSFILCQKVHKKED
ncbi:unnamed protein product [Spirodela intermedia]|uniref:Uncharacterized protein n=1 Tax=Spirodela intermedia TaxID=51605 RepID=A0A7I8IDJ7_SPIIN|nr:unnamed protein product [Spirodela intermedia]CAA6655836.1 unnamed protein product [Spirodela intermedia]